MNTFRVNINMLMYFVVNFMIKMVILVFFMVISVNRRLFRYFGSYSGISVIPVILVSRRTGHEPSSFSSAPAVVESGSFRSYFPPVRSFWPSFRDGSFGSIGMDRFGLVSKTGHFCPILGVIRFGLFYCLEIIIPSCLSMTVMAVKAFFPKNSFLNFMNNKINSTPLNELAKKRGYAF